ncbi:MAG: hypothetical protein QM662_17100 [Gordonia sp. (in: high G+C Gram-positive bacteria)]
MNDIPQASQCGHCGITVDDASLIGGLRMGGDCLADLNQLRADPTVFGPVVSDPTATAMT